MKSLFPFPKFLLNMLVIASGVILSCNNNSSNTPPAGDTTHEATTDTVPNKPMMMDTASVPMVSHAEATLSGTYADTTVSGTVKFDADSSGKVKMMLEITVPAKANKSVAVHIHEHGDCGDTAKMAHGHWNPTHAQHGKWGTGSFHLGDIGNVKLNAKGKGTLKLTTDLWSLGGKPDKNILGRSIIVHGGVDDYKTQPSGNSGTRIGCGVIQ
jgi:Cu-Zn family superoxide dismutase